MPKPSAKKELASIDRMVASTIRGALQRQGSQAEAVSMPQDLGEFFADLRDDEEQIVRAKMETVNRFIDYVFQDGPDPSTSMQNFFAIVHALRPEALYNMSGKEIGLLLGRTKAAHFWRLERVFSRILKNKGAKGVRARFQKSEEARISYSKAQMGNHNRTKNIKATAA